eukprot:5201114-Pyramimonas_sp.AAC.1
MIAVGVAKRAFVKLLREMVALHSISLTVSRNSQDPAVRTAHRKVSVKARADLIRPRRRPPYRRPASPLPATRHRRGRLPDSDQ